LAAQIRQNTRSMRAVVVDSLPFIFATFKLFENAWFQQRQGNLDAEQWRGWDAYIRTYYHRPE
jgi:hypothetical protein